MKLRTLDKAAAFIKEKDPDTDLTRTAIRRMGLSGQIPVVMVGAKRLYDLDTLENFLYLSPQTSEQGIHPVEVRL